MAGLFLPCGRTGDSAIKMKIILYKLAGGYINLSFFEDHEIFCGSQLSHLRMDTLELRYFKCVQNPRYIYPLR